MLALKDVSSSLNQDREHGVSVVILLKTDHCKPGFSKKLGEVMEAEHTALLYYNTMRWLSWDELLPPTFKLQKKLLILDIF